MKTKKLHKIKKIAVSIFILVFSLVQTPIAIAQTVPTPPEAPTPPESPTAPDNTYVAPTPPEAPDAPTDLPSAPEAPTAPEAPELPTSDSQETDTDFEENTQELDNTLYSEGAGTGSFAVNEDVAILTGDASNNASIVTDANNNITTNSGTGGSGSVSVVNSGNGAMSDNSGSASVSGTDDTDQINSAQVVNDLDQTTITGTNSASFNTGGDSVVVSGDANTSGTVITSVNTNVDGVAVAEFNIVDDHIGDIVLDFGGACVSGCGTGDVSVQNVDNGSYSDNDAQASVVESDNTNQVNDATVTSNLTLSSDSGNNDASFNTNGNSTIATGDANVSANVLTLANNNLAGNVILGVVNIYGDLVGDIILTEAALNAFCGNCLGTTNVENSGNGTESTNVASSDQTSYSDVNQYNNADIENNLILTANSGGNDTSANTGGDSAVVTGDANVLASVVNIANMNIVGGNWWLVIVNEAGNWIGKLIGFDGSTVAGSEGMEFRVDEYGQVYVSNADNGTGSENNAQANVSDSNTINQENNAKIVNNVDLSANTGGNTSSFNTGGDSTIVTGDANIIANIVNFVNNNIIGAGNLFVTVINVFGSWVGDFIGPGQTKTTAQTESAIGGSGQIYNNESDNSSSLSQDQTQDTTQETLTQDSVLASAIGARTEKIKGLFAGVKIGNDGQSENIAYAADQVSGEVAGDKIININLAYLLLFVPVLFLYIAVKKYSYLLLPKKVRNG